MTCQEKLATEYPEKVNDDKSNMFIGCPHHYGYLPKPMYCHKRFILGPSVCNECWNREVKE